METTKRVTAATVNAALKKLGLEERIKQGNGYVYVIEGSAHCWYTSSIPVCKISFQTCEEWVADVKAMKQEYEDNQVKYYGGSTK